LLLSSHGLSIRRLLPRSCPFLPPSNTWYAEGGRAAAITTQAA
jgi:hypothetical protein